MNKYLGKEYEQENTTGNWGTPIGVSFRKRAYWRGFKACMWLVVLPVVGLAVLVMSWM